jgi:hypothetical protein
LLLAQASEFLSSMFLSARSAARSFGIAHTARLRSRLLRSSSERAHARGCTARTCRPLSRPFWCEPGRWTW